MKRKIKSKNGFTLIEIIIVVGIIVILSGATFVGVNEVLDRANANADDLQENHGAHFEEEAWATVKNLSVDVEQFKETSETSLDTEETTESEETEPTESSLSPNDKDEEFLKKRQELLDMGYLESEITIIYDGDGHIKGMSWRSTRRGIASGVARDGYTLSIDPDAADWEANAELEFDDLVQSVILQLPAGSNAQPSLMGNNVWMYSVKDLGNGRWEIVYSNPYGAAQDCLEMKIPAGTTVESFTSVK